MSDADALEREAEAARARLAETADELRARMSPGQLMDEVLNQFRDGDGSQMLANLRTQARDNPMALALVGGGLAWLMMGSGASAAGSAAERRQPGDGLDGLWQPPTGGRDPAGDLAQHPSYASDREGDGEGMAGGMTGAFASARDSVGERWQEAKEGAGRMAHDVRTAGADSLGSVGRGVGAAGRMAHDVRTAGSDALAGVRHGAADLGEQARRTFVDVLDREPLVIGALGLAVGAAIGALLPASELERQHLGATGEALKDKAGTILDRGMAAAKEAAAEVYESAREEADRQGLLPGDQPLADKIGAVVRTAGETAGSVAERHAGTSEPHDESGRT